MDLQRIDWNLPGFIIFSLLIIIAEVCIYSGYAEIAVEIHLVNLIALIAASCFIENRSYQALMLLPLFRLGNLAMPVFFQLTLYSFALVYSPMVALAHSVANISLFFIVPAYFELFLSIIAISLFISAVAFVMVEGLSGILDPIQGKLGRVF